MKKSKNKKIFDNKIFLMAVSLLISVSLWAYITNQDTSTISKTLSGVQVQFEGEDILNENGLAISNLDNSTVDVTIRGRRRAIGKLDNSDVTAVIDVSNITKTGQTSWSYNLKGVDTSSITVINRSPDTVSFMVSNLESKTVKVIGEFIGTTASNYMIEDTKIQPSKIKLTGPEAVLDKVANAYVAIDGNSITSDINLKNQKVILVDKDGKEVAKDNIKLNKSKVNITLNVLEVKELPLKLTILSGGGATSDDCTISINPETIKIAGTSDTLDSIDSLNLGTIDLSDIDEKYENTFEINLGDNIDNIDNINEANVSIELNNLVTKEFTISSKNIKTENVPDGLSATILTKSMTVKIRGYENDINDISSEDITAIVNLKDIDKKTGTISKSAKIEIAKHENSGAIGNYTVSIYLGVD